QSASDWLCPELDHRWCGRRTTALADRDGNKSIRLTQKSSLMKPCNRSLDTRFRFNRDKCRTDVRKGPRVDAIDWFNRFRTGNSLESPVWSAVERLAGRLAVLETANRQAFLGGVRRSHQAGNGRITISGQRDSHVAGCVHVLVEEQEAYRVPRIDSCPSCDVVNDGSVLAQRDRQQLRAVLHRLRKHQHSVVQRVDDDAVYSLGVCEIEWRVVVWVCRGIGGSEEVDAGDAVLRIGERDIHRPERRAEAIAHSVLTLVVDGVQLPNSKRKPILLGRWHILPNIAYLTLAPPRTAIRLCVATDRCLRKEIVGMFPRRVARIVMDHNHGQRGRGHF